MTLDTCYTTSRTPFDVVDVLEYPVSDARVYLAKLSTTIGKGL